MLLKARLASLTFDYCRKSVIYAAYSVANPQKAFSLASNLGEYGSGNSYSNELYFISTRTNPSGTPICSATVGSPLGTWTLQYNGKYVVSSASNVNLVASGTSGTSYTIGFSLNVATIRANNNGQYVTADQVCTVNYLS
jgi:endo-1,3(4)-beta-glucanase